MGEQYVCPHCDHIDSGAGECPECGGSMVKLDDEVEKFSSNEFQDADFDLGANSLTDFDDFDDSELHDHHRAII
jgi:hypothetical protein